MKTKRQPAKSIGTKLIRQNLSGKKWRQLARILRLQNEDEPKLSVSAFRHGSQAHWASIV